jgi:ribosomal protein RSM22 (predicted rRNA methylase)
MQLPGPLREAIERELSGLDGTRLRAAAARLSERYRRSNLNEGRPHLPAVGKCWADAVPIADEFDRAAYLAVRMPATFAASAAALTWTRECCEEASGEIRSVLDLGSGPGTALWAAAEVFPTLAWATAIERDPSLIEMGRRLAAHSERAAVREAQWLCGDLRADLPTGSWDAVVCAYACNEIPEGDRARLIRQAWERCAKLLVIVEPGTKAGFANVLSVRSSLLAPDRGADAPVLVAPCPHALDCPMASAGGVPGKPDVGLLGRGDWCHFAARVERTSLHRRLKHAELGHEDEKFSYMAFLRGAQQQKPQCPQSPARIVRHPRIFSGYAQLTLCKEGRLEQTTVTRSQKEDWRRLKRLGWGDRW